MKGAKYTVYDAPNLEIYIGKGKISGCRKLKEAWEEKQRTEGNALARNTRRKEETKTCELCYRSSKVMTREQGCQRSLCQNCITTGSCCPCMEQEGEQSTKERKERKDGMARCVVEKRGKENEDCEIVIGEGEGKAPLGGKTIRQIVDEVKEEIESELEWWERREDDVEGKKVERNMTIRTREVWINENVSTIEEREMMSGMTRHKKICNK